MNALSMSSQVFVQPRRVNGIFGADRGVHLTRGGDVAARFLCRSPTLPNYPTQRLTDPGDSPDFPTQKTLRLTKLFAFEDS